jgi:hypothetical protein
MSSKISETKQMPKSFNITFFNEDNSSNKEVSMLRLKSELMQNRNYYYVIQNFRNIIIIPFNLT